MIFIDLVEQIELKYRNAKKDEVADSINHCLLQGGTLTERWLILADWLTDFKKTDFELYKVAFTENQSLIEAANKFFEKGK